MCRILFRGKQVDDGNWVEGFYVCLNGTEHRIYSGYAETDCGDFYPDWSKIDSITLGSFTGLYDDNGKHIFEGDILKVESHDYGGDLFYGKVVCESAGCYVEYIDDYWHKRHLHKIGQISEWRDMGASGIIRYQYELVGNAFDNPELLKKVYEIEEQNKSE